MKIILYFMRNYYLSSICRRKIKPEEVARIYSTTPENVGKAVKQYKKRKNPFKTTDSQTRQGTIQIIISIVSALLVLLTLFEMQNERNAAYMPNISINCPGMKFIWNKDHEIVYDSSGLSEELQRSWNAETAHIDNDFINMSIQNTGVGVAKDVYVDWCAKENISAFQKLFSGNKELSIEINQDRVNVKHINGWMVGSPYYKGGIYKYGYLKANLDTSETLSIPVEYTLLYQYAYAYYLWDYIPEIKFIVSYNDVQGETYIKTFIISPKTQIMSINQEGDSMAMLDLIVKEESTKKHSFIYRHRYTVINIIIGAVIISVFVVLRAVLFEYNRRRKTDMDKDSNRSSTSDPISTNEIQKMNDIEDKDTQK